MGASCLLNEFLRRKKRVEMHFFDCLFMFGTSFSLWNHERNNSSIYLEINSHLFSFNFDDMSYLKKKDHVYTMICSS